MTKCQFQIFWLPFFPHSIISSPNGMCWWVSFKNLPQYNYSHINFSNRLSKTHTHRHSRECACLRYYMERTCTHTHTHTICFHDNCFHGNCFHGNHWADHVPTVPGDCLRHVLSGVVLSGSFPTLITTWVVVVESAVYHFLWLILLTIFSCVSDYTSRILLLIKSKRFQCKGQKLLNKE